MGPVGVQEMIVIFLVALVLFSSLRFRKKLL